MIPIGDGNALLERLEYRREVIETDMIPIGDGNHHITTLLLFFSFLLRQI